MKVKDNFMNFNKLVTSIPGQVAKLKERGLRIDDEKRVESYHST
jgi:hypothetical protein